jgi:acyl-coenzyme A synthetase/AMP-(fatty) acid ligase
MSECSTFISTNKKMGRNINIIGRPQKGRRVAIINQTSYEPVQLGKIGIICISSKDEGLMIGYTNENDIRSNNKEWFATGDLGKMSAEGFIEYFGRADDTLNQGGFRVSPTEIENAFEDLEGLDRIVVFNLEIKQDTNVIAAMFVTSVDLNEEDLKKHAKYRLASYKIPRVYIKSEAIPTSNNGKISRKNLSKIVKGLPSA